MSLAERFEAILAGGDDSARVRFALGAEYLKLGETHQAIRHLREAVSLDPEYSAAWKLLGKAQSDAGLKDDAVDSYRKGIGAATGRGDEQAAREMQVFLKRLQKTDRA